MKGSPPHDASVNIVLRKSARALIKTHFAGAMRRKGEELGTSPFACFISPLSIWYGDLIKEGGGTAARTTEEKEAGNIHSPRSRLNLPAMKNQRNASEAAGRERVVCGGKLESGFN